MDEVNTPKLAIKTISANWKLHSYGKQQTLKYRDKFRTTSSSLTIFSLL